MTNQATLSTGQHRTLVRNKNIYLTTKIFSDSKITGLNYMAYSPFILEQFFTVSYLIWTSHIKDDDNISEISETLDRVSVSTSFVQSRSVSVSITVIFLSLDKSRSRHLWNFPVSMSLGLDIYRIFQSRWVSVSTNFQILVSNQIYWSRPL